MEEAYFDLKNVTERYKKYLLELANMQAKIRDMREDFKSVSEHLGDAGDTYMDADEVLIAMGSLLADCIVYASEYDPGSLEVLKDE